MTQIQPHIDAFAFLILLGVIQGFILTFFFLQRKNRIHSPNIFIGLLILTFSIISLDIFLCYTGYMARMVFLDNYSESLSFLIGPLFYLYVYSNLKGKWQSRQLLHLLPFAVYTLYNLLYILQPSDYKYFAYAGSYFPSTYPRFVEPAFNPDPLYLRDYLYELIGLQLITYFLLSIFRIVRSFREEKVSLFVRRYKNLTWLRNLTLSMLFLFLLLIHVKTTYGRDLGDYLISSFMALIIYGTSANVIRSSGFFAEHLSAAYTESKKYARSSLSESDKMEILEKLKEGMEKEKYYRNSLVSQAQLSKKLLVPSHHISQVINEKLNQSFFEFIAYYRIREAEQLLSNTDNKQITIEEIAEQVGYISKSAFNKTFKKITGKTPSEYRI